MNDGLLRRAAPRNDGCMLVCSIWVLSRNKKPRYSGVFYMETSLKCIKTLNHQNFHQGFLLLGVVAAVALAVALSAAPAAALVTLSFRQPFSSQLNRYQTRL
jgi:hypothetical protein